MAGHRLLPGESFAGRFRVESLLGEGAMALVYAVQVLDTGQRCALKILRPDVVEDDPKAFERFSREVQASHVIGSEHVVATLGSGVTEGHPWLLMELLEGLTLDAYVAQRNPPPVVRWHILDQLLGTMALAHHVGVLHRDLKSENVMVLDRDGWPFIKLLDFGGAKNLQPELHASLTDSGLGTPLWVAPEQSRPNVRLSASCDVWALGLLTFFVLTSKIYWRHMNIPDSTAIDLAMEVLRTPLEPASTRAQWLGVAALLPPDFDDWFQHCVNREPSQRFQTAGAAHAALSALGR